MRVLHSKLQCTITSYLSFRTCGHTMMYSYLTGLAIIEVIIKHTDPAVYSSRVNHPIDVSHGLSSLLFSQALEQFFDFSEPTLATQTQSHQHASQSAGIHSWGRWCVGRGCGARDLMNTQSLRGIQQYQHLGKGKRRKGSISQVGIVML